VSEYPGILNWIRKGAVLLRKNKFKFPESEGGIRKKVTEMGLSALGKSWAFARGFYAYPRKGVVGDRHNEVDFADIYKDIVNYAEENGFPVVSKQTIASHFKDLGFGKDHKRKTGGTVIYKCFGLHTDDLRKPVPIVVDMDVDIDNEEFVYDEEEAYY
jgi:hypothetical protein